MRTVLAIVLSVFAVACSGNPSVRLTPHEPPAALIGIPWTIELEVTVVDSVGGPIEGADVILRSEPVPRHATTPTSGVVRFVGFITDPRFFMVCAPGFICSTWIDMQAAGFGSMRQTVTLQRAVAVPHLPNQSEATGEPERTDHGL